MANSAPLSFKTRGGGGLGGVAYKDRARPPPRGWRSIGKGGGGQMSEKQGAEKGTGHHTGIRLLEDV